MRACYTLPVALASLSREHVQDNELMMAGSVVTILPVLLLFLVLQRYTCGPPGRQRQGMRKVYAAARAMRAGARACCWQHCFVMRGALGGRVSDRLLDGFETLGGVDSRRLRRRQGLALRHAAGIEGRALRLDFDFGRSAGYAFVRRELPLDLPENFELSFWLRAKAPANNFEVKLADASGDNVWWFSARLRVPRRVAPHQDQEAADRVRLGADPGPHPARIDSLEFVVARRPRRRQRLDRDRRSAFRELPPPPTHFPPLSATASSSLSGAEPRRAVDGDARTTWRSDPKAGAAQSLNVDLGMLREFGGLELHWQDGARPRRYDVEASGDGVAWHGAAAGDERRRRQGCAAAAGRGGALHQAQSSRRRRSGYALAEFVVRDWPSAPRPTHSSRPGKGCAARPLSARLLGEQTYWTLVGVDGGPKARSCPKMARWKSAGAAFRSSRSSCHGSRLVTWADVTTDAIAGATAICPSRA